MIEVNWSLIKSWSKTESITAIYMSNTSWLSKTEHVRSHIHQPCSSPVDPIQYLHMCKGIFHTTTQKGETSETAQTLSICLANLTGSRVSSSSPRLQSRRVLEEAIWPEMTLPIILCSELWGYGWPTLSPNFDAREQRVTNTNILEVKATAPGAAYVSCGADRHFNTDPWYCYSYQSAGAEG